MTILERSKLFIGKSIYEYIFFLDPFGKVLIRWNDIIKIGGTEYN
jgi:hypothetical protein